MAKDIEVFYEATPNPQSMKFRVTEPICSETIFFDDPLKAQRSPLASKVFGFPWAAGVYLGPDFVTITKQDWVEWSVIADPLAQLIKEHLDTDEPVLFGDDPNQEQSANLADEGIEESDSEAVKQIKRTLNIEIRPAVAMDGGDIVFDRYVDGVLYLQMQGACSGCPSSMVTLKEGVETRLQEVVPEIKEVVSV